MAAEPHRLRHLAESFGVDAARYDRTRPSYPTALIERIVAAAPGPDVVDVGCGTGTAARQFAAAGARVLGVEPDARMAAFARDHGLEVEVSAWEGWDDAGRRFDVVVAGTAWHWVDPAAGAAVAARVLRPNGLLVPMWNVFQLPESLTRVLADEFRRLVPDAPMSLDGMSRPPLLAYGAVPNAAATAIRDHGSFAEPAEWVYEWDRAYSREEWLDQLPTLGAFTSLPPAAVAELAAAASKAIDELGGAFTAHYTTIAVAAVRR